METIILDLHHIEVVVNAILLEINFAKIILLKGDLGSGKTTLAKQLIQHLGVNDTVTSPTFNIVSEYQTAEGEIIYHFDLYRINSIDELYEIGFEEYLDSGNVCIIEWPEIATPILTTNLIEISIEMNDEKRIYSIEKIKSK